MHKVAGHVSTWVMAKRVASPQVVVLGASLNVNCDRKLRCQAFTDLAWLFGWHVYAAN